VFHIELFGPVSEFGLHSNNVTLRHVVYEITNVSDEIAVPTFPSKYLPNYTATRANKTVILIRIYRNENLKFHHKTNIRHVVPQ
jgi:hypothetical protein